MTTDGPPTLGLVLAGGLARRMGGGDKPLIEIGGAPILDRVLARFAPGCVQVILNANGDPARFASYRLPVVADDVPGFQFADGCDAGHGEGRGDRGLAFPHHHL